MQFIGVIFSVKPTIITELCEHKTFVNNMNKNDNKNKKKKNNSQFCDIPLWYFANLPDAL